MAGSTPIYGFPYPEATDLVADYPALGQELAEDIEAALPTVGGLAPATPTTIANSGGSASLTGNTVTFTGVSSVSLNGCFTGGDYDNYRLIFRATTSQDAEIRFRWRASGSDQSAGNYVGQTAILATGTWTNLQSTDTGTYLVINYTDNPNNDECSGDLTAGSPQAANNSFLYGSTYGGRSGTTLGAFIAVGGRYNGTTGYDGFTIYPSAGTITGTVSVYGYKS